MRCELFHNNKSDFVQINFSESFIVEDDVSGFKRNNGEHSRVPASMDLCTIYCNKTFFFRMTAAIFRFRKIAGEKYECKKYVVIIHEKYCANSQP